MRRPRLFLFRNGTLNLRLASAGGRFGTAQCSLKGDCAMSKTKRFLSKAEVRDKVKLSYAEIARREKAGKFPPRLRLGNYQSSRAVWLEEMIDAWMEQQIARL